MQVRDLQGLLAQRDETLKSVSLEKSRLELEAEGYTQRIKTLDDNEQRYKDENWSLETQTHELMAAAKEATNREEKLLVTLNATNAEKSKAERELDELRQTNGKLLEDHKATKKAFDTENVSLRRNLTLAEGNLETLQRKVEEITSQNQELARAVAGRYRNDASEPTRDTASESEDFVTGDTSPEHSPPPSPSKATPRHGMLESETLKSSLHHAHRMIQNLKSNIHREKTEKMELKRMLQDARDDLERSRGEGGPNSGHKRQKTKPQDLFKKPARPGMLGAGRNSRTDVSLEEADWEEHDGQHSPSQAAASRSLQPIQAARSGHPTDVSDAYQTANETEDAFETANEKDTTTDAFETGAESMAGDSSEEQLTETEDMVRGGTVRGKRPSPLLNNGRPPSFVSTASTSADEEEEVKTPSQAQAPRYKLRIGRGGTLRRSIRSGSLEPSGSNQSSVRNSPASFGGSQSPQVQGGQSLFAELGDFNADSDHESVSTPGGVSTVSRNFSSASRPSTASRPTTARPPVPEIQYVPMPRPEMIDSGMMTESWEPSPTPQTPVNAVPPTIVPLSEAMQEKVEPEDVKGLGMNIPADSPRGPSMSNAETQYTPKRATMISTQTSPVAQTPPRPDWSQPTANFAASIPTMESSVQTSPRPVVYTPERSARRRSSARSVRSVQAPSIPVQLGFSSIQTQETTPVEPAPATPRQLRTTESPLTKTRSRTDTAEAQTPEKNRVEEPPARGILGSVFGRNKNKAAKTTEIYEDETRSPSGGAPPADNDEFMDNNSLPISQQQAEFNSNTTSAVTSAGSPKADQGSQTILSSQQIDQVLEERSNRSLPPAIEVGEPLQASDSPSKDPTLPTTPRSGRTRVIPQGIDMPYDRSLASSMPPPKRPSSASSTRRNPGHPPLPPDHKQVIAAVASKQPSDNSTGTMGPPLTPASAYRVNSQRPTTPSVQPPNRTVAQMQSPTSKDGTTPKAGRARSQISRRSSISSFASEIDERFQINAAGLPIPQGVEPGTDPRMIQAITQTMIGEFLWKYTRKPGRGEMSSTRHRRYFWVHPYTRTLYWSDQDPQSAGRSQLHAKSVAIEAVRVVTDDNPFPPGLHRKSLEIHTPGRKVKITAATGQRHETWFNALSYLLLRTANEANGEGAISENPQDLTAEDVDEFNPSNASYDRSQSRTGASRLSLSSYNSRGTRNTAYRNTGTITTQTPTLMPPPRNSTSSRRTSEQPGSMRRISNIFRPTSYSSKRSVSRHSQRGRDGASDRESDIYNASVVRDSAEDLRMVIERQEQDADRLENVRACCDGESPLVIKFNSCQIGKKADINTRKTRRRLPRQTRPSRLLRQTALAPLNLTTLNVHTQGVYPPTLRIFPMSTNPNLSSHPEHIKAFACGQNEPCI